jgi:3-oxoacyl-[acyl-carrier protein] reductase
MASSLSLDGKVTYVTGATRGIGHAIAQTFAAHGATVLVNGRDRDRTVAVAEDLAAVYGVESAAVVADQSIAESINDTYRQIFRAHHRLDVLVNNAGILDRALLGMITEESIENTFSINAMAVARNMQGAARLMQRSGGGSIINISSIVGANGAAGHVAYAGSKAAVIGMTRSAAKELAPSSVRVNVVAPGLIDTDIAASLPTDTYQETLDSIGMGRIGTPQDVANVVLFLASDLASYVTGQTIGVDGAMVI